MNINGMNLIELAAAVDARAEQRIDVVASGKALEPVLVEPTEGEKAAGIALSIPDSNSASLAPIAGRPLPLTDWAQNQLADRLEIPRKYFRKMQADGHPLLLDNVRYWLETAEQVHTVRTNGTQVRALLSSNYRRIDNDQILKNALKVIHDTPNNPFNIVSCAVTDWKLSLALAMPTMEGEVKRGDIIQAGWVLNNGEIGNCSLSITPFTLRLVCTNGMTSESRLRQYTWRKNHSSNAIMLGKGATMIEYSNETRRLKDEVLLSEMRDVIERMQDRAWFDAMLADFKSAANSKPVANPVASVTALANEFSLRQPERDAVLQNLIRDNDYTRWGMANAVTALANTHESYDRANDIMDIGGQVINMRDSAWQRIVDADSDIKLKESSNVLEYA